MAARSTYRYKKKPAIPFGDLMLPILGVVFLGILIVGVRVFFLSGDDLPPAPTPRPIVTAALPQPEATATVAVEAAEAPQGAVVAQPAVPVTSGQRRPAPQPQTPQPQPAAQAPAASRAPAQETANVSGGSFDTSAFLVQCGSFRDIAAANRVASGLQQHGHAALVRSANVRGTTYYRVFVAGGRNRSTADAVASQIKVLGHPTLVVTNQ